MVTVRERARRAGRIATMIAVLGVGLVNDLDDGFGAIGLTRKDRSDGLGLFQLPQRILLIIGLEGRVGSGGERLAEFATIAVEGVGLEARKAQSKTGR